MPPHFIDCSGPTIRHPQKRSGSAKFIHLWQNKDGAWTITRVLSFDHVDSK